MLEIWVNAFIPLNVPGYTRTVAAGIHKGKTGIPLPSAARLANWRRSADDGFLGDQRTFSAVVTASSRMHSIALVDVGTTLSLAGQIHNTSGTTDLDLVTGKVSGMAPADMTRCAFKVVPKTASLPSLTLELVGKANDPLVNFSADIDYTATIIIVRSPNHLTVSYNGLIDDFPAFEAYARYNNVTKTLFTSPPPPGNTVMNLLGAASRPVTGVVAF